MEIFMEECPSTKAQPHPLIVKILQYLTPQCLVMSV